MQVIFYLIVGEQDRESESAKRARELGDQRQTESDSDGELETLRE